MTTQPRFVRALGRLAPPPAEPAVPPCPIGARVKYKKARVSWADASEGEGVLSFIGPMWAEEPDSYEVLLDCGKRVFVSPHYGDEIKALQEEVSA